MGLYPIRHSVATTVAGTATGHVDVSDAESLLIVCLATAASTGSSVYHLQVGVTTSAFYNLTSGTNNVSTAASGQAITVSEVPFPYMRMATSGVDASTSTGTGVIVTFEVVKQIFV